MPRKPAVVCAQCGRTSCTEHGRKLRDKERGTRQQRGYDAQWQKLRLIVLAEEPLCRFCKEEGRTTAATDVDHIEPISSAPHKRLERSNLRSLCHECHSRHTATQNA